MSNERNNLAGIIMLILFVMLNIAVFTIALPQGPTITYNHTETAPVQPAALVNTSGGTFTTLVLNITYQNDHWKAYAGNVTGKMALQDANSYSIYDWSLATVTGEVFASRNSSINWAAIQCAQPSTISTEDSALNQSALANDNIANTFNNTVHKGFFVGGVQISNSTCPSIDTFVNNTRQVVSENALFQEILLQDSSKLVYTTLLQDKTQGFNFKKYDFQMIVAEDSQSVNPTPYYFWVELS